MNSNLIPERRTDKNGKTITRWVKSGASSGKSKAKLPAPTATPMMATPHLDELFHRANLDIRNITPSDLDPRTMIAVEEMMAYAKDHGSVPLNLDARDLVFGALKEIRDNYGEQDHSGINNVAVFGMALVETGTVKDRMFMYTQGLHQSNLFTEIDDFLLEANDEQRSQAKALIQFVNVAPKPWSDHYYGYDESDPNDSPEDHSDTTEEDYGIRIGGDEAKELTDLIMDHYDQIGDIMHIVDERGSADVTMLRSLLGHDEQPLRSGL